MIFNFLVESLKASGINNRQELELWTNKLNILYEGLYQIPKSATDRGEALFRWLWKDRPNRYTSGGSFRLTEVINAQLDPQYKHVGNCLGLTLLFNSLAQRLGLKVGAIHMEKAFGRGPHVLSLVYTETGLVQIEHIFPDGFDYRAHRKEEQVIWDGKSLVADIYSSRGTESFLKGDLEQALTCYEKALAVNPGFLKAQLNLGITLFQMRREKEATEVLSHKSVYQVLRGVRL